MAAAVVGADEAGDCVVTATAIVDDDDCSVCCGCAAEWLPLLAADGADTVAFTATFGGW